MWGNEVLGTWIYAPVIIRINVLGLFVQRGYSVSKRLDLIEHGSYFGMELIPWPQDLRLRIGALLWRYRRIRMGLVWVDEVLEPCVYLQVIIRINGLVPFVQWGHGLSKRLDLMKHGPYLRMEFIQERSWQRWRLSDQLWGESSCQRHQACSVSRRRTRTRVPRMYIVSRSLLRSRTNVPSVWNFQRYSCTVMN